VGRAQVFGARFRRRFDISATRNDGSIVVVDLCGEGGGYTILGCERIGGAWQFKVDGYDVTPALIDDKPATVRRGDWVPTLQDVLGQINHGWYFLHARNVNPQFQTALLAEVTQRILNYINEHGELDSHHRNAYQRWQTVCGVDQGNNADGYWALRLR
jgi:hypothetical protein